MADYNIPVLKVGSLGLTITEIKARLVVIDQIIAAYEAAMLAGGSSATIVEYEIHTGQTRQRVEHSDPDAFVNGLMKLQRYRDFIAGKASPRKMRLLPASSIIRNC